MERTSPLGKPSPARRTAPGPHPAASATAAAEERAAIARELHDVVAHGLSVMIVQADGAGFALDRSPQLVRTALATIADTGRSALDDMRRMIGVLRGGPAEQP